MNAGNSSNPYKSIYLKQIICSWLISEYIPGFVYRWHKIAHVALIIFYYFLLFRFIVTLDYM